MVNHLISVDDLFSMQPEVLARFNEMLKDPATAVGLQHRAQALAEAARLPWLGAFIRNGVLNTSASPGAITKTAGTNLTFTIDALRAVYSPYGMDVPGVTTLTSDPVTSARWDLVVIRSYDTAAGQNGITYDQVEIVKGTTTADPALPARSIALWRIKYGANATSFTVVTNVDDLRKFTAPAGGTIRIAANTDATGLPVGTPLYDTTAALSKIVNAAGTPDYVNGPQYFQQQMHQNQTLVNNGVTLEVANYTFTGVPAGWATFEGSIYVYSASNAAGYFNLEIGGVTVAAPYLHTNTRAYSAYFPFKGSRQITAPAAGNLVCRIVLANAAGGTQMEIDHTNALLTVS